MRMYACGVLSQCIIHQLNHKHYTQSPPTYNRQVLALAMHNDLSDEKLTSLFPADVVARARKYKSVTPHGFGAYTNSTGV
jgi:hypothetical protein